MARKIRETKKLKTAKRVLVADDEAHIVRMVADKLTRAGLEVTQVRNGAEALEKAKAEKFDLIITDIVMPELDGYELTKQLKSDPQLKDIPVIMLTALGQDEDEIKGREVGADEFITKPFSPRKLSEQIVQMIKD